MKLYPYWNDPKRLFVEVKTKRDVVFMSNGDYWLARDDGKVWVWHYDTSMSKDIVGKVRPARWYEKLLWRWLG
jgi:hypothetical protein